MSTSIPSRPFQRYRVRKGMFAWMLHRFTGLALVLYLCLHVWGLKSMTDPASYNAFIATQHGPLIKVGEILLIGAVVYHALNGIRVVLIDFVGWSRYQHRLYWTLGAIAIVLFIVAGYPSVAALIDHYS